MNCQEARLQIGADPLAHSAELQEHLSGCADCRRFQAEMGAFEADIRRALARPPQLQRRARAAPPLWRPLALAASVAAAAVLLAGVWLLRPTNSLAHEVVAHVQGEPNSWFAAEHISSADIDAKLRRAGVVLDINSDQIMYAQSCWFRGHYVPHLVVQTTHGPATVMILKHQQLRTRQAFHESGLSGELVPVGAGSIAVLTRGDGSVDDITAQMQQDVHWMPDAH